MTPVRIGLLGCGTVGSGVIQLLHAHAESLAVRAGAPIEIARVLVRDASRDRVPELDRRRISTDPEAIFDDSTIDVVVEVMGGIDPARGYVERALDSGRSVVSANKMLLALHGPALVQRAIDHGTDLAFEASVGGGIPVIRVLREALASDAVTSLFGIVNGTCNFILSRMRDDGLSFDAALSEAQQKGYAEADPGLDIDGHDAAHKLVVLAMLAFGAQVESEQVPTEGIRMIESIDHEFAKRFGFAIKHLAIGYDHGSDIELRVHPALVPRDTAVANVNGVLNAIAIEGRALGSQLLSGRGAGAMPTAVSVVADILDVVRARRNGASGLMTRGIRVAHRPLRPLSEVTARYYVRFQVYDKPGVLARITGILGESNISIEQLVQQGRGGTSGAPVQVVMLTHEAVEKDIKRALHEIDTGDYVAHPSRMLRVHGNTVSPRS